MRVLVLLEIEEPDYEELAPGDPEEQEEQWDDFKMSILDGLTSVDLEGQVSEYLETYYTSENLEDAVHLLDAKEVLPSKDKRKLQRFKLTRWGTISQEGAR